MKNTEAAFYWITEILENNKIPYKISGGMAAKIYGVTRELADIDIEIENKDLNIVSELVKPYLIFGPTNYKDEYWDLTLMTLTYLGQDIDISGSPANLYNKNTKQWEQCSPVLENVEVKEVYGKKVPVESLESLIAYKTILGREVDQEDVRQLLAIKKKIIT